MWARDVEYHRTRSERVFFKRGTRARGLLQGWRQCRDGVLDNGWQDGPEVWGQPSAWTDEVIASWQVQCIRETYGPSLAFAGCPASHWTLRVHL